MIILIQELAGCWQKFKTVYEHGYNSKQLRDGGGKGGPGSSKFLVARDTASKKQIEISYTYNILV